MKEEWVEGEKGKREKRRDRSVGNSLYSAVSPLRLFARLRNRWQPQSLTTERVEEKLRMVGIIACDYHVPFCRLERG